MNVKQRIVFQQWNTVRKTMAHMEEFILKLMANPETNAEHLAKAHAMYSDVCKRMAEISHHVDNVLRTGSTTLTQDQITPYKCCCGYEGKRIEGQAYRCASCGML